MIIVLAGLKTSCKEHANLFDIFSFYSNFDTLITEQTLLFPSESLGNRKSDLHLTETYALKYQDKTTCAHLLTNTILCTQECT